MAKDKAKARRDEAHHAASQRFQQIAEALIATARATAMTVHDEIEQLRTEVDDLWAIHADPAAHGRNHHPDDELP